MSNNSINKILEGVNKHKRPLELKDAITVGEKQAKKMGAEQNKWAVEQRKNFMSIIYHACMQEIKPNGFEERLVGYTISGNLSSFYANEIKVDTYCPPKWRTWFEDYMIDYIKKNERKFVDSRYEFIEKDGQEFVRTYW